MLFNAQRILYDLLTNDVELNALIPTGNFVDQNTPADAGLFFTFGEQEYSAMPKGVGSCSQYGHLDLSFSVVGNEFSGVSKSSGSYGTKKLQDVLKVLYRILYSETAFTNFSADDTYFLGLTATIQSDPVERIVLLTGVMKFSGKLTQ